MAAAARAARPAAAVAAAAARPPPPPSPPPPPLPHHPSPTAPDWPRLRPLLAAALMCLLLVLQLPRPSAHDSRPKKASRADAERAWAAAPCPVAGFAPPSLAAVAAGEALPALFGGLYHQQGNGTNGSGGSSCLNCRRHGFWSDFCSFDPSAKPLLAKVQAYGERQLCPSVATRAWVRERAREAAAAAALSSSASPSTSAAAAAVIGPPTDFLTMAPCDLWRHVRGRTLWILGDSMAKDLYRAVLCLLVEFWADLNEREMFPAAAAAAAGDEKAGEGAGASSATAAAAAAAAAAHALGAALPHHGEPRCAFLLEGARVCFVHVVRGDLFVAETGPGEDGEDSPPRVARGVLPTLLGDGGEGNTKRHPPELADASKDVFVLNFGLWHGLSTRVAYNRHLHELGAWVTRRSERERKAAGAAAAARGNAAAGNATAGSSSLSSALLSRFFWFETPKQHFADAPAGEFPDAWLHLPSRAGPHACAADEGVRFRWDTGALEEEREGGHGTAAAAAATLGEARALFARRLAVEKFDAAMLLLKTGGGDRPAAAAAERALALALGRNGTTAAAADLEGLLLEPSLAEERRNGDDGGGDDQHEEEARLIVLAADALRRRRRRSRPDAPALARADARAAAAAAAERLARRQNEVDARAADDASLLDAAAAASPSPSSPRPPPPLRPPWPRPPPPVDPRQTVAAYVAAGGWRNADARRVLGPTGYGLRFVAAHNASVPLSGMHRLNGRGRECSHFCMPSAPQLWVAALRRALDLGAVPPAPAPVLERRRGGEIHWEKDSKAFGWPWKVEDMPGGGEGAAAAAAAAAARRGWRRPCDRLFCFGRK